MLAATPRFRGTITVPIEYAETLERAVAARSKTIEQLNIDVGWATRPKPPFEELTEGRSGGVVILRTMLNSTPVEEPSLQPPVPPAQGVLGKMRQFAQDVQDAFKLKEIPYTPEQAERALSRFDAELETELFHAGAALMYTSATDVYSPTAEREEDRVTFSPTLNLQG